MDKPFEAWARAAGQQHPSIQKWLYHLIDLNVSWDSFERDTEQVLQDLVQEGGIPMLAARDIIHIASAVIQRSHAPMAIFWDLENVPIPMVSNVHDVISRIMTLLACHGDVVHVSRLRKQRNWKDYGRKTI
jgi:hypothetical protein